MSIYFNLTVKEVVKETDNATTLVFDGSAQHISYKPGQFLTLILTINGESIRRSYSLCTYAKIDKHPAVTIKRVQNGKASNYILDHIKEGDIIEAMEAMGTFTIDANYQNKRNVVLIGAGSGITPLMSIAKAVLSEELLSKVYLLFGNRNEQSVILSSQLRQLKELHKERFNLVEVFSQPLGIVQYSGRLNRSLMLKIIESFSELKPSEAEYFICGPKGMMEEAQEALKVLSIHEDQIHKESFLSTSEKTTSGTVVADNQNEPKEVTIIYQGSEYKFIVPVEKTILETALDLDIDLPFSCQSGMCTACMGKCTSGKVYLDDPDGLSQKEIEQGFVLTCVGHPVSGNVIIEID
jgi:ring-1,2-phenylacetyl-CoA epoxidase subunit PaaE